jgi:hypothetical protein
MQRTTETSFYVSPHFVSTLIDADWTSLENHEMQLVEDFWNNAVADCPDGFEFGHFSKTDSKPELMECAVSERLDDCVEVTAIYWNKSVFSNQTRK